MRMDGIRCKSKSLTGIILVFIYGLSSQPLRTYIRHFDPLGTTTRNFIDQVDEGRKHLDAKDAAPSNVTESSSDEKEISLVVEYDHEPYLNRWQRRFASSEERNKKGGYLFFRHMRKAGGTSLRDYFRDVLAYHNVTRTVDDFHLAKKGEQSDDYHIHYIEHEFQTIDWQCPVVDPRWRESVRIIVLRHPIERHLSEFFFSGNGKKFYPIDKQQLSSNQTYAKELAALLSVQVPRWMKRFGRRRHAKKIEGIEGQFNMIFGPYYTDNFQLRALAGCSSGDCLEGKNVTEAQMEKINEFHPSLHSYLEPVSECTQYFRSEHTTALWDTCAKPNHVREFCSIAGCDGPCFYPSVAWGEIGTKDVTNALTVLKSFDAVLIMEDLGNQDQSDFLSDVLGVPRDAEFSLARRSSASNTGVQKNGREKTHFYRDLLLKLGLPHIHRSLHKENELEIEFFNHAVNLNAMMIDQWKRENDDN